MSRRHAARVCALEDATEELAHLAGVSGSASAMGRTRTFLLPVGPQPRPFVVSVLGD